MKTAIQRVIEMCDIQISVAEAIEVGPNEYYDAGQKSGVIMGIESLKKELEILFELEAAQMFRAFKMGHKVGPSDLPDVFELWYKHVFGIAPGLRKV